MKAVIQRVQKASVTINNNVTGQINKGILLLLGICADDSEKDIRWLAGKVSSLRIFPDNDGKMNLSLLDSGGEILVVSQFTLYGDCRKGRRPGFSEAAPPEIAEPLYEKFIEEVRALNIPTATGVFGADMQVALVNDGPVTFIVDTHHLQG